MKAYLPNKIGVFGLTCLLALAWTQTAAAATTPETAPPPQQAQAAGCPSWQTQLSELTTGAIKNNDKVVTARHRGEFTDSIPENSLAAFAGAYKNCRPAVETDVRSTSDGNMVVFHDANVGKMLEPAYDPINDSGPNEKINNLNLLDLQSKRLVDVNTRQPTAERVPTVTQMLQDYLDKNGQSLIHLEIKEAALIMPAAKLITEMDRANPGKNLKQRIIVKFNMAEYPSPQKWQAGLSGAGAATDIMGMPVITPFAAERIKDISLPNPPDKNYVSNVERAVALWSSAPGSVAPIVEVLIKDSTDFVKTERKSGPQGLYTAPANLDYGNALTDSMADMVTIVKRYQKPLGVFVPVPDYIMWRTGVVTGFTVPNTFGDKKPMDVATAFFNNTSSCCYRLPDRLGDVGATHEREDLRMNLSWNRDIGANMITADDTDSVDTFYSRDGALDTATTPSAKSPSPRMQSTLSWQLGYVPNPAPQKISLKGWNGASSGFWGGQVCIYNNPYGNHYAWVYNCNNGSATESGYSDILTSEVVGDKIRIRDPEGKCLSDSSERDDIFWSDSCQDSWSLLSYNSKGNIINKEGKYAAFQTAKLLYKGQPYSKIYWVSNPEDYGTWTLWKMDLR